ncbi:protein of unknown function [Xenorhabdus doucetiae]|uniref:Uncharacterized protein n=1 Tax=Xenorhabdus doucetiae TaxID=351671 RepID=A0A068QS55_9GAMM|nr:protein of unknown function [Xenorhabdus doucetiae]
MHLLDNKNSPRAMAGSEFFYGFFCMAFVSILVQITSVALNND